MLVFLFSVFCFLLCVFCVIFCIVLCIVPPHVYNYFLYVYKFTDHCYRVETQLQLMNITSYLIIYHGYVTRRIHCSGDLSERIHLHLFNFQPPACLLACKLCKQLDQLIHRGRHSRLF